MKVCHLTSVHKYSDTRIFVKECASLSTQYETHLIAPEAPETVINGVYIHGVNKDGGNRLKRMTSTVKKVYHKSLDINADVYHFHDPELMPVGWLLKRKGKKVIYDVHEDVPKQVLSKHWIPQPLKKPVSWVVKKVEKIVSSRLDAIVTATPDISQRFRQYNPNTVTVQNFPLFAEWEGQVSHRADTESQTINLVYVGSITRPRGIVEMVKVMEEINKRTDKRIELLLGGKFSPSELQNDVSKLGGWQYVNFLGWLSREQVKEVLSRSHIGLVLIHPEPRYMVSYPVKLFEYMSAGIPVVASDFPLWRSIIEDSHCGIVVDPLNIEDITQGILQIINDEDLALEMSKSGQAAVKAKYNWDTEAEKLLSLYRHISGQKVEPLSEQN
jgi:glycosyltransferase involved in cell wall biosynthesis